MRFGLCILPEHPWSQGAPMWREAEAMGFDHAWTYDHLVWGGLPDAPWFGMTPTLTAAAMVTERIQLGSFVTSPNFRHPVTLMRDLLAIDDISGGRLLLGIGSGGDPDSTILGGQRPTPREKVDRLAEFTELLDLVLTRDHVDYDGRWFTCRDARTLPGPVTREGRPRIPFVMAANGPRSMRIAARHGQGWVTTGAGGRGEQWWQGVRQLCLRLDDIEGESERDRPLDRYLALDIAGNLLTSLGEFTEAVGRARELGFSDVVVHWPRPEQPYAGRREVLDEVAAALPELRG